MFATFEYASFGSGAQLLSPSTNTKIAATLILMTSNDKAHLPGLLVIRLTLKSLHAAPVRCSAWLGGCSKTPLPSAPSQ